jgi:hypothetical protein
MVSVPSILLPNSSKTINSSAAMTEEHPAISAVGRHFDEEVEIAALAHRYYVEEGCPEGRSLEHWLRAEREFNEQSVHPSCEAQPRPPTEADIMTEEMMRSGR